MARSLTLILCSGCGHPFEFANTELNIPIFFARLVIKSAKPFSVPSGERASAKTTQASLPDKTIIPRSKSSTVTLSLVFKNIVDPRYFTAASETGSFSVSSNLPCLMYSKAI